MLAIDLLAFGAIGVTVWAVQMLGYRSPLLASSMASATGGGIAISSSQTQVAISCPGASLIGGEELHKNHDTYPASAKPSVRPYEFDLGWAYIRTLEMLGLATLRRGPPQLRFGSERRVADATMLNAIIANRYELKANYSRRILREALVE